MSLFSNTNLGSGFRSCAPGVLVLLLGSWAGNACGGVSDHTPGSPGSSSGGGVSGSSGGGASGSSGGGASGSSGGGATGSSSGGSATTCPSLPPEAGTGCIAEGLWCQYGDDPNLACDRVFSCQEARWAESPTLASVCPTAEPGTNGCPAAYPSAGEVCASTVVCAYAAGLCGCGESNMVIELPDGGATDFSWLCEDPGAGCPEPRPAIGSPCENEGLACTYGTCAVIDSMVGLTCSNGAWTGGGPAGCAL